MAIGSRPPSVAHVVAEHAAVGHSGGLGEVVRDLGEAQAQLGTSVRVLVPVSTAVSTRLGAAWVDQHVVQMPWGEYHFSRWTCALGGVRLDLLTCPSLFDRPFLYGPPGSAYEDNTLRYTAFCRAAAAVLRADPVEVVHAHDWHAGLVVPLLGIERVRPRRVFTIHNPVHQGAFGHDAWAMTGLGLDHMRFDSVLHEGQINPLKAGLEHAEVLTTVSPTHAQELQTQEGGFGLHEVYRWRRRDLVAILNGITPRGPALPPTERGHRRTALARELSLDLGAGPLLAYVGRLDEQKGVRDLAAALPSAIAAGASAVLIGTGDPALAGLLRDVAGRTPRVRFVEAFDPALATRVFDAADAVVVPSLFEPCGLVQLHAMHHGAVPVVRRVGGLADTVRDAEADGWGFVYEAPHDLPAALQRVVRTYIDAPARWARLAVAASGQAHPWAAPARRYLEVYAGSPSPAARARKGP